MRRVMRQPEAPLHGQHSCLCSGVPLPELSTGPQRAHPLHQPLPAPTQQPHYGTPFYSQRKTGAQNSLERQTSWGLKARCLAPPCCSKPKGWLSAALEEEGFAAKESRSAPWGRSKCTRRTLPITAAFNTQKEVESWRETLPSTLKLLHPMLSENLSQLNIPSKSILTGAQQDSFVHAALHTESCLETQICALGQTSYLPLST